VLFDVGANIGIATLIAARTPGTRAVAFEPEPANFARLTENLRLIGLDNVVALPLALGDNSGIATLTLRYLVAWRLCEACLDVEAASIMLFE
jgi:FkbM family methyltransferase